MYFASLVDLSWDLDESINSVRKKSFPSVMTVSYLSLSFYLELPCSFPMDTFLRELSLQHVGQLNNDGCRMVHFYFGDRIPRDVQNDITSEETVSAMELLFDQGKINAEDTARLIDGLNEVSAKRWARAQSMWKALLERLASENIRSRQNFGPSLARPLVTESHPTSLRTIMARCEVDDFDSRRRAPSEMKPMCSRVWKLSSLVNLLEKVSCVFLLILMFLVGLVILSLLLSFSGLKKIDRLTREKQIASERYRTVGSELNNEEANPLIKYGKKFVVSVGYQFDDSTTVGFKFGYYLSELNIRLISNNSESYEFRYSPDHFSDHIHSLAHGKQPSTRLAFNFHRSKRITVVEESMSPPDRTSPDRWNK